jgi:hypothetical protein
MYVGEVDYECCARNRKQTQCYLQMIPEAAILGPGLICVVGWGQLVLGLQSPTGTLNTTWGYSPRRFLKSFNFYIQGDIEGTLSVAQSVLDPLYQSNGVDRDF